MAGTERRSSFRFRPRFHGLALVAITLGLAFAAVAALVPQSAESRDAAWVAALLGIGFGSLYLLSPTWRFVVEVTPEGLAVRGRGKERFRLRWSEVEVVVASPTTHTCFVDGGAPEHSLLVPGVGAPASYRIENSDTLYDAIIAHVPAERVEEVESLKKSPRFSLPNRKRARQGDDDSDQTPKSVP